jgi:chromosomal replication initiation ATPase DnaA
MSDGFEPLAVGLRGIKTRSLIIPILKKYGVDWETMISHRRLGHLIIPRFEIYTVLRDNGYSSPRIGMICNRDHTSILHGVRKFRSLQGG